jgi:hypothetical protein
MLRSLKAARWRLREDLLNLKFSDTRFMRCKRQELNSFCQPESMYDRLTNAWRRRNMNVSDIDEKWTSQSELIARRRAVVLRYLKYLKDPKAYDDIRANPDRFDA